MKYLDREPQVGDRVRVEYDGEVVTWAETSGLMRPDVLVVKLHGGLRLAAPMVATRVIAPEPKVGDVVTADMDKDLPGRSLLECPGVGQILRKDSDQPVWWDGKGWVPLAQAMKPFTEWRIVRIGGTS